MFEVKKIGNQWLIRPTGGQFRQLKIPAGACHVEVSDNFLLVDDIVYEIKESGNVAYVEKLQSIPIADGSNDSAFHSEGGAISEETWASGSHAFVEKLQGISIAEQSDESVCYSKSNTNAECEKGSDNYLSLEMEDGQTEYDSLDTGQNEETNVVEIFKGEVKGLAKISSSNTTVMFPQQSENGETSSNPRDAHSKFSLQYKELFEENLDFTLSTFRTADVEQKIQSIQAKLDVCCVLHSNKSQLTIYGQSEKDVKSAKKDFLTLLLPPRNYKTESDDIFITNENVVVKVYVKDILNLPVDCIVNDANTNLDHRGGIAKAVSNAAGAKLDKESFDYVKSYGNLKVGSACKTTAGKLKYKFVLHAVGPCWELYQPFEKADIKRCEQDLYNAVLSSLCLAERHDARTIAMPTISSGDCPKEFCSVQYARAILDYSRLAKHPLGEICIVDFNPETIEVIKQTFRVMIPSGKLPDFYRPEVYAMTDERKTRYDFGDSKETYRPSSAKTTRVTDHNDKRATNNYVTSSIYPYVEYAMTSKGSKTGELIVYFGRYQELHMYSGDILSLSNVDIIVCGNDKYGKSLRGIAMALAMKCRDPYKKEVEMKFRTPRHPGDIVFVSSRGLTNVKWIAHVVPFTKEDCKSPDDKKEKVTSMYEKMFYALKDKGCHSLALPFIIAGQGKAKPDFQCKCLLEALETFCGFYKNFKCTIHLVHWEPEMTRKAIECAEQKIREWPRYVNSRPANQNLFRSTAEESSVKPNENRKL